MPADVIARLHRLSWRLLELTPIEVANRVGVLIGNEDNNVADDDDDDDDDFDPNIDGNDDDGSD